MDRRLWYFIAGTRGGINRARILWILHDRPHNANDLATQLTLDYKTVRHHLDVLHENDFVMTLGGEGYGILYSLSPRLQVHFEEFLEIWKDRKSTRLNSSHTVISYAVFCLKKKKKKISDKQYKSS